jgi:hypothetical protein
MQSNLMRDSVENLQTISTREQALAAWDKRSVVIRESGDYAFVYPLLRKGVKYPGFDLRRDCCLNNFVSVEKAKAWVEAKGWEHVVLR